MISVNVKLHLSPVHKFLVTLVARNLRSMNSKLMIVEFAAISELLITF